MFLATEILFFGGLFAAYLVYRNWYPEAFIKYYATFEHTSFDGGASRPAENVILFRTQLAF